MTDGNTPGPVAHASAPGYWVRTRRLAVIVTLVWAAVALGLPLVAVHLGAVSVLGIPFGYYIGSQGAMILVPILLLLAALRQSRIDRDTGRGD